MTWADVGLGVSWLCTGSGPSCVPSGWEAPRPVRWQRTPKSLAPPTDAALSWPPWARPTGHSSHGQGDGEALVPGVSGQLSLQPTSLLVPTPWPMWSPGPTTLSAQHLSPVWAAASSHCALTAELAAGPSLALWRAQATGPGSRPVVHGGPGPARAAPGQLQGPWPPGRGSQVRFPHLTPSWAKCS